MSPEQVRECMSEYDVDNGESTCIFYFNIHIIVFVSFYYCIL